MEITHDFLKGDNSGGENLDGDNIFLDSARGKCSDSMFLEPVSTIRAFGLGEAFELSGPANATGDACTGRCSGAADSSVSTRFARDFF